jgi:Leucine-rich repeat (LRR) protein
MRPQILLITTLLISCSTTEKNQYLFERLTDQETVTIYLSKYHLDSIPSEIGRLKKARKLYVTLDSSSGWTIYPPLSTFFQQRAEKPPFKLLPSEITELSNLKNLRLVELNLKQLPDDFGTLENLDSLDLTLNKLTISNELDKLMKLKKLKYLGLFGNSVEATDIEKLKKGNPDLTIVSGLD